MTDVLEPTGAIRQPELGHLELKLLLTASQSMQCYWNHSKENKIAQCLDRILVTAMKVYLRLCWISQQCDPLEHRNLTGANIT